MLVLSRYRDERIIITDPTTGARIEVMVVEIRDNKVRLGVSAPIEWPVHRAEVQDAIDREHAR